jgi:hypothetical protein
MNCPDMMAIVHGTIPATFPVLEKLQPTAQGLAQATAASATRPRTEYNDLAASCGVQYTASHYEIVMWYICILLSGALAGLLLKKAENEHCYRHSPCNDSAKLHLEIVTDFVAAIDRLSGEIKAEIARIKTAKGIPVGSGPASGPTTTGTP